MLRLHGDIEETDAPAPIQILGDPVIVTPDVRVFDPLTGQTVDVVLISGGNPHQSMSNRIIVRVRGGTNGALLSKPSRELCDADP